VLAVKLYNAGGRFDVTEKTAFHMDMQLFAPPPPGEYYYSLLPNLAELHRVNFANFFRMELRHLTSCFNSLNQQLANLADRRSAAGLSACVVRQIPHVRHGQLVATCYEEVSDTPNHLDMAVF